MEQGLRIFILVKTFDLTGAGKEGSNDVGNRRQRLAKYAPVLVTGGGKGGARVDCKGALGSVSVQNDC